MGPTRLMDRGVLVAVQRFPQWGSEIRRLALADAAFRSLCEDLVDAQSALALWTRSEGAQAVQRCNEYETLVRELSEEIAGLVATAGSRT